MKTKFYAVRIKTAHCTPAVKRFSAAVTVLLCIKLIHCNFRLSQPRLYIHQMLFPNSQEADRCPHIRLKFRSSNTPPAIGTCLLLHRSSHTPLPFAFPLPARPEVLSFYKNPGNPHIGQDYVRIVP